VDDDAGMRQSLDGLVRSLGYRAALFSSAEAFLAAPEAAASHCVISDLQMPGGMDGIQLARTVGAPLQGRVILMSAFLSDKTRGEASDAGVRCVLHKPFDGETLIGCIESILSD
jgi:FixJ family two-component response regulator